MSSPDPAAAPQLSRRAAWALALTATLTMAVSYVDRQALAAIIPSVQSALKFGDPEFGDLLSAFAIAYLVGAPIAGRLIDRVGARRGLLGAVVVWSAVAAVHAIVPGFGVLFALRILLGLSEAPSFPAAAQTVHRALPPADRARGYGILFTGSSIGAMIAPPLATRLCDAFGFRAAFFVTALVGLSWVPLWITVAYSPAARAALDSGTGRDAPKRAPIGPFALLAHGAVLRAVVMVIASAPMLSLLFNWSTKFLVHDHHLTQRQTGDYLWFPPLVFDAGAVLFGHFASRARAKGAPGVPRSLVAIAMVVMLTGALIPLQRAPLPAVILMSIAMAGGGGLYALATADMLARVPPGVVSSAGGITAAAQSIAHIVANPLIGRTVKAYDSYTPIILALTAWILPGAIAWLVWRPPPPYDEEVAPSGR
jgi:ACS family hexuronate transporter-like MFS transporter